MKSIVHFIKLLWRAVLAVLRFLNLLEPAGSPKISLTKLGQWLAYGLLTFMVIFHPDDPGGLGAAIAGVAFSTGAAMYRRHQQYRSGADPYGYDEPKGSMKVDSPD